MSSDPILRVLRALWVLPHGAGGRTTVKAAAMPEIVRDEPRPSLIGGILRRPGLPAGARVTDHFRSFWAKHIYGCQYICFGIYYVAMTIQPNQFFQLLSDETRLRSLLLMQQEGELCVCELTHALGMIQPKISRHLAALRDSGVVKDRRQGQWIYYRLHPDLPHWARQVIKTASTGILDQLPFRADRAALTKMPNRPGSACCA